MQKAQVTFCGQGEANSGTTAAPSKKHRDDFFLTASVPPSTTRKSQANGSFQVCCTLKWRKKVKIPELSLSILGCWKQPSICAGHTSAGRQGAACLSLAKLVIRELKFYLQPEIASEKKIHLWILQDVCCLSIRGGLRYVTASSGHAPPQTTHHLQVPAHSERLFSLPCLRDTPAQRGTKSYLKARQT